MGAFCRRTNPNQNKQVPPSIEKNDKILVKGNLLNPRLRSIIAVLKKAKLSYIDDDTQNSLSPVEDDPIIKIKSEIIHSNFKEFLKILNQKYPNCLDELYSNASDVDQILDWQ